MRELLNDDLYILSEIIDKMDADFKLDGKDGAALGIEITYTLARKAHKAKNEVNKLIAAVTGKAIEEVEKMKAKDTIKIYKDILGQEGVLSFFTSEGD